MIVFPNVKINLGLFVTSKRPDGYHNIESVFYPLPWTESLEIISDTGKTADEYNALAFAEVGKVRFFGYQNPIPGNADSNLCIKVFNLLEGWFNLPKTEIHLQKSLPIGAGMGGGSADAAFTLRALKEFYNLNISDFEAKELLAKVGSDCPFFWDNKPAFVFGRGERMQPIELDLSAYKFVVVNPNIHISTKEAYSGIQPKNPPIDLKMIEWLAIETWKDVVHNDFENNLFTSYPEIKAIKDLMYESGAIFASMTGSGSTVFGIFDREIDAHKLWPNYQVWHC